MAGPQHAHMTKAELIRACIMYATETYPNELSERAIRAISFFNNLQTVSINDATFQAYVDILIGKINVTQPALPADLDAMAQADLVTLADSLELANWDYGRRAHALTEAGAYWVRAAETGTIPTIQQFRDTFLWMANKTRSRRGLPAIT